MIPDTAGLLVTEEVHDPGSLKNRHPEDIPEMAGTPYSSTRSDAIAPALF
jgi:hypothetical protein